MVLKYGNTPISGFRDLISSYPLKEFDSPFRSTVPHLSFWRKPKERIISFCQLIGIAPPSHFKASFEFQVAPVLGRGKPSHTDLMLEWESQAVTIEAKYTEPAYPKVIQWLEAGNSVNRLHVLEGWLDLINNATDKKLISSDVLNIPYQVIHRVASACSREADKRIVVYLVFDGTPQMQDYYSVQLNLLKSLLPQTCTLAFALVNIQIRPKPAYRVLKELWESGQRGLHCLVINGLIGDTLMKFEKPQLESRI